MRKIKRFFIRLKIIIDYIKIAWSTEDFEYSFAVREFCWKLRRVGKHIKEHAIIVESEIVAKEIEEFCHKLERFSAPDQYYDNFLSKELDRKYGEIEFVEIDDTSSRGKTYNLKRPLETEANKLEIEKLRKEADLLAVNQRQEDLDRIIELLSTKLITWWD